MSCPFCNADTINRSGDCEMHDCGVITAAGEMLNRDRTGACHGREMDAAKARIQLLISERDTARFQADQKWSMRRELEAELGTADPEQAIREIRKLKARLKQMEARP